MKKIMKTILALIVLNFIMSLGACSSDLPENNIHSAEDISGRRVGIFTGSEASVYINETWSDSVSVSEYGDEKSIAEALLQNNVECVIASDSAAEKILKQSSKLGTLNDPLIDADYSVIAARENPDLTADINSALKTLSENGTLKNIINGYVSATGYVYSSTVSPESVPATLTLVVDTECAPYSYCGDSGEIVGIDVDVAKAVCDVLGLGLKVEAVSSDKLISTIQGGWADFAMGRFVKDDETAKLVDFSDAYMHSKQVIIVRKK